MVQSTRSNYIMLHYDIHYNTRKLGSETDVDHVHAVKRGAHASRRENEHKRIASGIETNDESQVLVQPSKALLVC